MPVVPGTRLGPYELVALIGAGGMGEVWRAVDSRLDRSVAIKILPAAFAQDASLRLRLEREAKTISQLNHPNICTLHDIGREDGTDYLVMELVEGETLADRVVRGALPISDTLRIGAQIADALDRAHRAGIVHRDLKPGNIMLTKSGAKLLDFGLAKSGGQIRSSVTPEGATQQKPLTQEGTILGTFQYMAPEQLEGLEADARTDIFALGTVLYEMATGKRAFQGASKTSLIAAIVSSEPQPMFAVQPLTPPAFEHVVKKCLVKDPDGRWQSAQDVGETLRWISEAGSPPVSRKSHSERLAWIAVLAIAVALAAYFALRPQPPARRLESAILPPEGAAFSYTSGAIALSPDGEHLAFVARSAGGKRQLWVRPLAKSGAHVLGGTEGATFPFWSPDGKYVGFRAEGRLKRVAVSGSASEAIADTAWSFVGATWTPGGDILFSDKRGILRLRTSGGPPVLVTKPIAADAPDFRSVSAPRMLPDGRHFLFSSLGGSSPGIRAASVDGGAETLIVPDVFSNVAYAAPGFLVYSKEGDLRVQPFDADKLKVTGDPVRLVDRVQHDGGSPPGGALFTVSENGRLVYVEGEGAGLSALAWVSRDGRDLGTLGPPQMFYAPELSHDGKQVAVDLSNTETNRTGDIWIFDLARNVWRRLTHDPANESGPRWSRDDRRVLFFSHKSGSSELHQRAVNGTGTDELLHTNAAALDVSPDGGRLAFVRQGASTDIWVLDLASRTSAPLIATPFAEHALQFSPDGKWIAFVSNESGKFEVYVQAFPESDGKFVVSRGGGSMPRWRGDGRELYYVADGKMMAVPIRTSPQFDAGAPVALFEVSLRMPQSLSPEYCVTRDGSKFLLNRMAGEEGTRPMTLVQNWTAALEK